MNIIKSTTSEVSKVGLSTWYKNSLLETKFYNDIKTFSLRLELITTKSPKSEIEILVGKYTNSYIRLGHIS